MRWNLRAVADVDLALRCQDMFASLATARSQDQIAFLVDTRAGHRSLFRDLTPPDLPDAAGTYRGTAGSPLEHAERAVFLAQRRPGLRARDACVAAADVQTAMQALSTRILDVWTDAPTGQPAYVALAAVTQGFFHVHPYLDGNGHILRIMLPLLAARLGLTRRDTWTLHARPYDHHMSLCLQWFADYPELLACYLRKWFV